jgi:hypothetical protein
MENQALQIGHEILYFNQKMSKSLEPCQMRYVWPIALKICMQAWLSMKYWPTKCQVNRPIQSRLVEISNVSDYKNHPLYWKLYILYQNRTWLWHFSHTSIFCTLFMCFDSFNMPESYLPLFRLVADHFPEHEKVSKFITGYPTLTLSVLIKMVNSDLSCPVMNAIILCFLHSAYTYECAIYPTVLLNLISAWLYQYYTCQHFQYLPDMQLSLSSVGMGRNIFCAVTSEHLQRFRRRNPKLFETFPKPFWPSKIASEC